MTITRNDSFVFTEEDSSKVYVIERGLSLNMGSDSNLKISNSYLSYIKYSNGMLRYFGYIQYAAVTGSTMSGYYNKYYYDFPFPITPGDWTNFSKTFTPTPPEFTDAPYIIVRPCASTDFLTPQLKWTKKTFTPSGASSGAWRTLRVWNPRSAIPTMYVQFEAWGHWTDIEVTSVEV